MAEHFDPYYKWLGIPPRDQPPNHYRLLGIELFEPDREVIDAAANRVMAYLKDLAIGDEAAYSQQLLNEIARARLCLLNRRKKEEYDGELRMRLAEQGETSLAPPRRAAGPPPLKPPKSPPPAAPPLAEPPASAPPRCLTDGISTTAAPPISDSGVLADAAPVVAVSEPIAESPLVTRPRRRRHRPSPFHAIVVVVIAAVLCLVILTLSLMSFGPRDQPPGGGGRVGPNTHSSLLLVLGEPERAEISEFVLDGQLQAVPPKPSYELAPGPHDLVLRRPGYLDVADSFVLGESTRHVVRVRWETRPENSSATDPSRESKKTEPPQPRDLPELDLSFGASKGQREAGSDSRLVAHWTFDDTLNDETNTIAPTDWTGQPQFVSGKTEQAVLLRSQSPIICRTTLIEQATELTIAFWIKLDKLPSDGNALFEFDRCRLVCRDQVILVELGQFADRKLRKKRPLRPAAQGWRPEDAVDHWVHWAFVYSSPDRRAQYYQNGRVVGSQRFVLPALVNLEQICTGQCEGALDELHIFKAALDDNEILALFEGRSP